MSLDQMVQAFEDAPVPSPSLLLGLNATARHILLQASEWRQQPEADRVVTLVTRLSALPVPSLDALGAAGKWWLSAGAQVYGRSECIYEALRELCGVLSEQALDRLAPKVRRGGSEESAIKQWFALRTYQLVNLRTLTAAFLAYIFAPHMARLEYTPLSFAKRFEWLPFVASIAAGMCPFTSHCSVGHRVCRKNPTRVAIAIESAVKYGNGEAFCTEYVV